MLKHSISYIEKLTILFGLWKFHQLRYYFTRVKNNNNNNNKRRKNLSWTVTYNLCAEAYSASKSFGALA